MPHQPARRRAQRRARGRACCSGRARGAPCQAALARDAFGRLRRPAAAGVWLASQLRALRERCSAIAPEAFAAVWRCAAVDCAALLRGGRPRKDADARREALLDAFHEVTRRPERYMRCD